MTDAEVEDDGYYQAAQTWAEDRATELQKSRRVAWIMVGVLAVIAILEAFALLFLTPLKTVVPYTLLVDRQTGHVEAIDPLDRASIAPDTALVRSMLVQYVVQRESFDIDSLNDSYRKVALWSAGDARSKYLESMKSSNPLNPVAMLPQRALVQTQIRSVSPLAANTTLVRFTTTRTDLGQQAQTPQLWAAVIKYRFSSAAMSAEDRMTNPLGFQVLSYRKDAEALPEQVSAPVVTPLAPLPAVSGSPVSPASGAARVDQ